MVMRKFKRFKGHKILAGRFLERLAKERSTLFVHWRYDRRVCLMGAE
jgi:hypothetical protein